MLAYLSTKLLKESPQLYNAGTALIPWLNEGVLEIPALVSTYWKRNYLKKNTQHLLDAKYKVQE